MNGTYMYTIPTTFHLLFRITCNYVSAYAGESPPDITLNNESGVDAKDSSRESCVVAPVDSRIIASTAAIQHCHMYPIPCPRACFVLCLHMLSMHICRTKTKTNKEIVSAVINESAAEPKDHCTVLSCDSMT